MADAATSKIRIRMGQVEIEYEGAHDYLSEDLPKLLETLVTLRAQAADKGDGDDNEPEPSEEKKASKSKKASGITGTVAALSAKLQVNSGPDLAIAAASQLTLVEGKDSFKRQELLAAMKSATSYYNQNYSSNLSAILKSLLNAGRLTEPATGTLALTAKERQSIEAKLSAG